jgi:hypothetical protein
MGQASSEKRLRRELARTLATQAGYEKQKNRPEIEAVHAAALADEELQARLKADNPGQCTRLRRAGWVQVRPGKDGAGWYAHPGRNLKLIHSVNREPDGNLWGHFSMSLYGSDMLPSWYDLRDAQWLLYPGLDGIQVVAREDRHYSIAEVLHIWTCLTADVLPAFGRMGSI